MQSVSWSLRDLVNQLTTHEFTHPTNFQRKALVGGTGLEPVTAGV
jgi:hypothetical protein